MRGNGGAVAVVRQAKGWTQAELARAASVSQGYVSKIENDQLDLEEPQLAELAQLLEVPSELLAVREPHLGSGVSCVHHRRRRSKLTATTAKRIESLTHLISLSITRLVEEVPSRPIVTAAGMEEEKTPAEAAQRIRAEAGLGQDPINNIIQFVETLGIVVIARDLDTDAQDGVSLSIPERHPVIVINTALSGDRQRLSVAHELGHLVLHGWHATAEAEAAEREAFEFAGELLAPSSALREPLSNLTLRDFRRLLDLKSEWGLSIAGLIQHAWRLNLIDEKTFRGFRIKLNDLGWTRVEPGNVQEEKPQLVRSIVDSHLDQMRRTPDKVASTALMLPEPFMRHYLSHRPDWHCE